MVAPWVPGSGGSGSQARGVLGRPIPYGGGGVATRNTGPYMCIYIYMCIYLYTHIVIHRLVKQLIMFNNSLRL